MTFGEYIEEKRKSKKITLRGLAEKLDIAPSYMSDIEKGKRNPNRKELIDNIAKILNLTQEEHNELYDLSAQQNENDVSVDLTEYIMNDKFARTALRTARDFNATEEEWNAFIQTLKGNR